MASQPRTCAVCPASLSQRNSSGYCALHHNSSPEKRRKMSESLKRAHRLNPQWSEVRSRSAKAGASRPGDSERRARLCRERRLWELGVASKTPEINARIGATLRAVKMAWCPPHLRDEARRLSQSMKLPHAQVRAIILEQHEAEMRRWRRSIGAEPESVATIDKALAYLTRAAMAAAREAGVANIWEPNREQEVVRARWAVFLALRRGGRSMSAISRDTGMDRKTVRHGLEQAEALVVGSPAFAELYRTVAAA